MSALGDVIVDALQDFLRVLFDPVESLIETDADAIIRIVVGTPAPDAVFGRPTNGAWPGLYDYYWEMMLPLALFVWALSVGLVIFFESTSYLFSSYHRSKLKKRAFSGLLGILMWWWIAALSLRFIGALTGVIVPSLGEVELFETLSFSAMGVLGVVIALAVDFGLFVLVGIIYFVRQIALYLFVLLMPLLIALWIPGVGPFRLVSGLMKQLARFYVPFLFMTVPVAVLFRVGAVLGENFALSAGGVGAWITALVIPIVAVASPFVLFWQAGALFFMTERMSRRASTRRARNRATQAHQTGKTGLHTGRNFARGVRGSGAVEQDGTKRFGSGDSRANRAGRSLRSSAQHTRERLSSHFTSEHSSHETHARSMNEPATGDESTPPDERARIDRSRTNSHHRESRTSDRERGVDVSRTETDSWRSTDSDVNTTTDSEANSETDTDSSQSNDANDHTDQRYL